MFALTLIWLVNRNEHANIKKFSDIYLMKLIYRTKTYLVIDSGYRCLSVLLL